MGPSHIERNTLTCVPEKKKNSRDALEGPFFGWPSLLISSRISNHALRIAEGLGFS